jgi:uncharacterized membrane protein YgcG
MERGFRSSFGLRSWARGALVVAAAMIPVGTAAAIQPGCGSVEVGSDAGDDAAGDADAAAIVTVLTPDAEPLPGHDKCEVTITTGIPLEKATHVEVCTDLDFPTNPPSGGPHWGQWAAFGTYEDPPCPREAYVHNMEHGGVVLLHDCEGPCPDVIAALEQARDAVSGDPKCLQIPGGPTERVILTPDPELDVPLAAAAWGATYTATCIDVPSLLDFVKKHYDHGPESTCAQGKPFGDPDGGAPSCDGGPDAGSGGSGGSAGGGGSGGSSGSGGSGGG